MIDYHIWKETVIFLEYKINDNR